MSNFSSTTNERERNIAPSGYSSDALTWIVREEPDVLTAGRGLDRRDLVRELAGRRDLQDGIVSVVCHAEVKGVLAGLQNRADRERPRLAEPLQMAGRAATRARPSRLHDSRSHGAHRR
jgi:hypothetical protein